MSRPQVAFTSDILTLIEEAKQVKMVNAKMLWTRYRRHQVNKEAALKFVEPKKVLATGSRVFFAPKGHRRLTINIPHEMHNKLRLMAVEQDTTITDILTKLVAKKLG